MSYKQLHNIYNESVAGKDYHYNRNTLLLELTINEASISKFAHQYLQYKISLDFSTPEHKPYINQYRLNNMLLDYCKEHRISLYPGDVARHVINIERIKGRTYRKIFKEFAHMVGDIFWREQRAADSELATYLLMLETFEPGLWGDEEDDGIGLNESDIFRNAVEQKIGVWTFLPMQNAKTQVEIKIRLKEHYHIAVKVMKIFNQRQKMLTNKDIFAYPSFFELVKTLATTRSKSEMKKAGADVERTINEIKAAIIPQENKSWIVIKPPSHAFSKKYFGYTRYSIKDILAIADRAEKDPTNRDQILGEISTLRKTKGTNWCTAANKDTHWKLYIEDQKTELYYFIHLEAVEGDELFAVRTMGSYKELANYKLPMFEQMLNKLSMAMEKQLGYGKGNHFASITATVKEVPSNMYGKWVRISPLDSINVMLNYLYHNAFQTFAYTTVIETRSQNNEMLDVDDVIGGLGEIWMKKHINFVTGIPSMSKEETAKAAVDICMKNREKSSDEVNAELLQKFK